MTAAVRGSTLACVFLDLRAIEDATAAENQKLWKL